MAWTTVFSPAKLNLFLELVARREDGFHELDTVMAKVGLYDRLFFRPRSDNQTCLVQSAVAGQPMWPVPTDQNNLIWQAIELLRQESGQQFGIDVVVDKRIPTRAGLGGGSSNAVSALLAVNRRMALGLPVATLFQLANRLGSDLAFFFSRAAARCTGRGQRVTPLPGFRRIWTVIGMPPQGLDTGHVFGHSQLPPNPVNSKSFCDQWATGSLSSLSGQLHNRLQTAATDLSLWIERMRQAFVVAGCRGHQMSGSGTSYFGLFQHRRPAFQAAMKLQARIPQGRFFAVPTVRTGADPETTTLD